MKFVVYGLTGCFMAVGLSACGGGSASAPVKTVTVAPTYYGDPTTAATAASPSTGGDPYADNVGARALRVGQARVGRDVTTVLLQTDLGMPGADYITPDPGKQFFAFRISTCVVKSYKQQVASSYNGEWFLRTKDGNTYTDNTSFDSFPSPKYPENSSIVPGDCAKGWMELQVPAALKKKDLEKLSYQPGDEGEVVAEWLLTGKHA